MRFAKKMLALMLTAAVVFGLFGSIPVNAAAKIGTPKISIKYVNDNTGVKVTIGKTTGAKLYGIYLKGYGDSYKDYMSDYEYAWRLIGVVDKDGSAERTYTIKGLPEGTYTLRVAVVKNEDGYISSYGDYADEIKYHTEKTITIKAAKTSAGKTKTYDFSKAKVGDVIKFGSYEQDGVMTNGKEDIEWIVLSKNNSKMLVISKYILDCIQYDKEWEGEDVTWENCSLRKWLNKNFYETAFTKSERNLIKKTKLKNLDNKFFKEDRESNPKGGNDTKDKLFILSLGEVLNTKYGFSKDADTADKMRACSSTAYAKVNGASGYDPVGDWDFNRNYMGKGTSWWWVRTPGEMGDGDAVKVKPDGSIYIYGDFVDDIGDANGFIYAAITGVRPAMYISLK